MKKHMKRLPAPRSWAISRKSEFWVSKPSPGPHSLEASVPLGLILRDMLKVCDTAREARHILNGRTVTVDGRPVTDPKFPVGFMDIVSLEAAKSHFRMVVDLRGRMNLVPVSPGEAKWKLCRIEGKTTVRGGRTQANLHDGRNVLLAKDAYSPGETLKLSLPDQKVLAHYDLAEGATALVTGGQHVGELGHILAVQKTRNPRANVVTFKEGFSTDIDKVFVVGKETPEIHIPEAPVT